MLIRKGSKRNEKIEDARRLEKNALVFSSNDYFYFFYFFFARGLFRHRVNLILDERIIILNKSFFNALNVNYFSGGSKSL